MQSLRLFAPAMFKNWWARMSCAVFTFIGIYALIAGKDNKWIVGASLIAAAVFFFVAAFSVWNEEHSARVKAEKQLNDEEPKIVFGLLVKLLKPVAWSAPVGSQEYVFKLTNHGKRHALYVHVDPIESVGGRYTLYFEDVDVIAGSGLYSTLGHKVEIEGEQGKAKLDKKMLWDFLHNNPLDGRQAVEYDVTVHFKDAEDERAQKFKMRFDLNTKDLSITPVAVSSW